MDKDTTHNELSIYEKSLISGFEPDINTESLDLNSKEDEILEFEDLADNRENQFWEEEEDVLGSSHNHDADRKNLNFNLQNQDDFDNNHRIDMGLVSNRNHHQDSQLNNSYLVSEEEIERRQKEDEIWEELKEWKSPISGDLLENYRTLEKNIDLTKDTVMLDPINNSISKNQISSTSMGKNFQKSSKNNHQDPDLEIVQGLNIIEIENDKQNSQNMIPSLNTQKTINSQMEKGISNRRSSQWTKEENDFLLQNKDLTDKKISFHLGRSKHAIRHKRHSLKKKLSQKPKKNSSNRRIGWSDEGIDLILNNPDNLTNKELGAVLGKSAGAVKQKRYVLSNQNLENNDKKWNESDLEFLEKNMENMSKKELAKNLRRGINSINMKMARLRGSDLNKVWDDNENNAMKKAWTNGKTDEDISELLAINPNSIRKQRINLSLTRFNDPKFSDNDLAIDPKNLSKYDKAILQGYLGRMDGFKKLGKEHNHHPDTLKSIMRDIGIKPITSAVWTKAKHHLSGRFNSYIPDYLKEILEGSMLGDANIQIQTKGLPHLSQTELKPYQYTLQQLNSFRNNILNGSLPTIKEIKSWNDGIIQLGMVNTASFRINKSIQEFKWVDSLIKEFSAFIKNDPKVALVSNPKQKLQWKVSFHTSSSVQLGQIWNEWYVPKPSDVKGNYLKVLPHNFDGFTPNKLLHLFTGDGSISPNNLHLYTNNFNLNDNNTLNRELRNIGIQSKVVNGKDGYYLRVSTAKNNLQNFYDYLSKAKMYKQAQEAMPYKFDKNYSHQKYLKNLLNDYPDFKNRNANLNWKDLL